MPRIIIGDIAVKEATGRQWNEWAELLDGNGARELTHKEVVAIVAAEGLSSWWSQMVTVTYEQMRSGRKRHQKADGSYSASVSKTIAAPVDVVFAAWENARRRAKWLQEPKITIRKSTPPKYMRITWSDGKTSVDVGFVAKGETKSQVAVEHSKLAAKKDVAAKKKLWSEALGRLKEQVEK